MNLAPFNWNDLKYFLAVVREGNPARAAKILSVDHSTVRRRITAIEEALSAKLFIPDDPNYGLTPQGDHFLRTAETVESVIVESSDRLTGADNFLSGTVRIGAPDGFGSGYLAQRLIELSKLHPKLKFELIAKSRQFNLSKREADIAFVISRPEAGQHIIRKACDVGTYLYASSEYLANSDPISSRSDLKRHKFVGYTDEIDFDPKVDPSTIILEGMPSPDFRSSNIFAQLNATRCGGGLCILPAYLTQAYPDLVRVLTDEVYIRRELWVIAHHDLLGLSRYRTVLDFLLTGISRDSELFC